MIMMIFHIQKILFLLWKHSYKENFRTQSKDSLIVILLSSYKYNMLITRQGYISLQAILLSVDSSSNLGCYFFPLTLTIYILST